MADAYDDQPPEYRPRPRLDSSHVPADNKTDAAYRVLRRAILDNALTPGTPLRLRTLQEDYHLGWTPLREALSRLEAERLVTVQRNCGFAVAPVSLAELADLTHARQTLELALLAESIEHGSPAWEDALVAAHYRLGKAALTLEDWAEASISTWLDRHQAFHRALMAGGTSRWLMHLYEQTMDHERRQHRVLMFEHSLRVAARDGTVNPAAPPMAALLRAVDLNHHTDLMEAALARDLPRATALVAEHLRHKSEVFSHAGRADIAHPARPA
jgi:GntR family carbon starvation induced transcriptional regulator